ncbi:Malonyl-[acyl-carrier protein] O-methyltransferase [Denitratisoma oestradiolicum]|uniref:Malonyl-[acyl-carrier protein] O-methyltransferase n=1 Tax=Denitratisoma oestradiolicum TaxID=311182 RepID=A0A6S6XTT1_9PROT|nr:Malonyl-[acyl-carrier protein] O-methyltransferase [Denitratisoma oestradiolicum]
MSEARHVRARFSRAAHRYDDVADFQRQMGERLLATLPHGLPSGWMLDGGCGTGHGLGLLRRHWPDAEVLALDFAYPMVARATANSRLCADLQALPLANASMEGIWSNLAIQWCNPDAVAREMARVLKPGGWLAASTLGPETFRELRQAFATVDRYRHTIPFPDPDHVASAFRRVGFIDVQLRRETLVLHYPDMVSLLSAVRDLGASRVTGGGRRPGLMGKAAWRRFVSAYELMAESSGLPLSYDTLCINATLGMGL